MCMWGEEARSSHEKRKWEGSHFLDSTYYFCFFCYMSLLLTLFLLYILFYCWPLSVKENTNGWFYAIKESHCLSAQIKTCLRLYHQYQTRLHPKRKSNDNFIDITGRLHMSFFFFSYLNRLYMCWFCFVFYWLYRQRLRKKWLLDLIHLHKRFHLCHVASFALFKTSINTHIEDCIYAPIKSLQNASTELE